MYVDGDVVVNEPRSHIVAVRKQRKAQKGSRDRESGHAQKHVVSGGGVAGGDLNEKRKQRRQQQQQP